MDAWACLLVLTVRDACLSNCRAAQFAGYVTANEKGFYADECLAVSLRPGGPNIDAATECVEKRADIGIHWLPAVLKYRDDGINVTVISQIFRRASVLEISW